MTGVRLLRMTGVRLLGMTGVRLLGMTGVRFIDTLKPAALCGGLLYSAAAGNVG